MALSAETVRAAQGRLLRSRLRILTEHGFYGLLLMHVRFALDEELSTAATDGTRIYFSPAFMDRITDSELDFVLMHEILHIVLMHCSRGKELNSQLYNIAADIVVNSNILASNNGAHETITLAEFGESMHLAPNGHEGANYTAEEVYKMLLEKSERERDDPMPKDGQSKSAGDGQGEGKRENGQGMSKGRPHKKRESGTYSGWDDHSQWKDMDPIERDEWIKRLRDAAEAISVREAMTGCGSLPLCARRILKELTRPETDWRAVLDAFVEEEIVDYSFSPPDRRFSESEFFLPDFNETEEKVENILFMIDTSGSMSDALVTKVYSEVKGAIDRFHGRLQGFLGFFDAAVVPPEPFSDEEEFLVIRPRGGGGTSFHAVFRYVAEEMEEPPASIVILTDGQAPFPEEKAARGIPVLWVIVGDKITPPWGKVTRIHP